MSTQNIFEDPGQKQTEKDFKPAPDVIETNFGTLKFELEAFPTEESIAKIYDEMDLQRATQAYMDFYPACLCMALSNPTYVISDSRLHQISWWQPALAGDPVNCS